MNQEKLKKNLELTNDQLIVIYDSGKDITVGFIRFILDRLALLEETVIAQQEEIRELKEQINKDSHNSSKPPSSDSPFVKSKPKNLRKKSGKKPGGQKGHKGSNLKKVSNPDEVHKIRPEGNCSCGENLSDAIEIHSDSRQTFDITLPQLFITEYNGESIKCKYGKIHYPIFPEGVTKETQYGTNVKILSSYLKTYGFVSYDRIAEFFSDVCNLNISQGTLVNFINECAEKAKPCTEEIKAKLVEATILNCDETGIRIEGTRQWLHIAGNNKLTYYFPHEKRGKIAMDELNILPNYKGTVVHDHYASYYLYTDCVHSLCNAHHLRELIFFEENNEKWAKKIIETLLEAKLEIENKGFLDEERIKYYKMSILKNITSGLSVHTENKKRDRARGRPKQSNAFNLLKRLREKIDDVL